MGLAVAMLVCVEISGNTYYLGMIHFSHRPNTFEPKLFLARTQDDLQLMRRMWAADDCREVAPLMLCRATCVMSTPLFPCMIENDYPVLFSSLFFRSQVEQSQYVDRCRGSMFSWRAALLDSVGGVEKGEGRVLSEVYLHWSTANETTWTVSFYGGNRFLRQRRTWAPYPEWTQCACYFFTGRLPLGSAVLAGTLTGDATAATIIGGQAPSILMTSSSFNLSSFIVGRPVQSWNQSIEEVCAPYAAKCGPVLGLPADSARNHFDAPPWRETYHKSCEVADDFA